MGILNKLAGLAGESVRIHKTANQEENLEPQTKQWLENLKQNAQAGNADAMFELGACYYHGQYTAYDPNTACYWWTEAANRGHVSAQYNLGLMYHGDVSNMLYDENLAGYWFNVAANNGDREAYEMLQYYKFSNLRNKWVRR